MALFKLVKHCQTTTCEKVCPPMTPVHSRPSRYVVIALGTVEDSGNDGS